MGNSSGRRSDRRRARGFARDTGIADDAVLFGVFGGLTPEKRIPQVLAALRALRAARAGGAAAARRRRRPRTTTSRPTSPRSGLHGSRHAHRLPRHGRRPHRSPRRLRRQPQPALAHRARNLRRLAARARRRRADDHHGSRPPRRRCLRWIRGRGRPTSIATPNAHTARARSRLRRHRHPRRGSFASPGHAPAGAGRGRCGTQLGRAGAGVVGARALGRGDGGRLRARHARGAARPAILATRATSHSCPRTCAPTGTRGCMRCWRRSAIEAPFEQDDITLNGDPLRHRRRDTIIEAPRAARDRSARASRSNATSSS